MLCFSQSSFFLSKGHVSRLCLARFSRSIQNWPLGCLFFDWIVYFCFWMEFMADKRARSCQAVVIVRLVFLPQLDETGVQVVLFFVFDDRCRGVHRAYYASHVVEKVINFR